MNELNPPIVILKVLINELSTNVVNARDLWEFLESSQQFADWIAKRLKDTQAEKGFDYISLVKSKDMLQASKNGVFHKNMKNPNGGRPQKEYYLTLDLAKEIAMLEKNKKGKNIRRYFIDFEKAALAELPKLLSRIDYLEQRISSLEDVIANSDKLIEMQEKMLRGYQINGEIKALLQEKEQLIKEGYIVR